MKRMILAVVAVLLAALMGLGALAEGVDISDMTLEELRALRDKVDARIEELEKAAEPDAEAAEEPDGESGEASEEKAGKAAEGVTEAGEEAEAEKESEADAESEGEAEEDTKADAEAEGEEESEAEEKETYTSLSKGARGEAVQRLQERLIELKYLDDEADGRYGAKTITAVKAFQKAVGVKANGAADVHTQELLFAEDAPALKVYEDMNYAELERESEAHIGEWVRFEGTALQVMEDNTYADTLGVYTVMRVSTRHKFDDVVYVTYFRSVDEARVNEDDKVTVYGKFTGLYTYESTSGKTVTIPQVEADSVERKLEQ